MKHPQGLAVLALLVSSCFLGCFGQPLAPTPSRHVDEAELIGSWIASDTSVSRIQKGPFRSIAPSDPPMLDIMADGRFSVRGFPILTGYTEEARPLGELVNGGGIWELDRHDEQTLLLTLDFDAGSVLSNDVLFLVEVAESPESGLIIRYWIGDPDLFQFLEYLKSNRAHALPASSPGPVSPA